MLNDYKCQCVLPEAAAMALCERENVGYDLEIEIKSTFAIKPRKTQARRTSSILTETSDW